MREDTPDPRLAFLPASQRQHLGGRAAASWASLSVNLGCRNSTTDWRAETMGNNFPTVWNLEVQGQGVSRLGLSHWFTEAASYLFWKNKLKESLEFLLSFGELTLFPDWYLPSLSYTPYWKRLPWCVALRSISLFVVWDAVPLGNHLIRPIRSSNLLN